MIPFAPQKSSHLTHTYRTVKNPRKLESGDAELICWALSEAARIILGWQGARSLIRFWFDCGPCSPCPVHCDNERPGGRCWGCGSWNSSLTVTKWNNHGGLSSPGVWRGLPACPLPPTPRQAESSLTWRSERWNIYYDREIPWMYCT